MPSSTSSSDRPAGWARFLRILLGVALGAAAIVYGFIVTVDPFDTLPASPGFTRWPVDGNARYAFPMLARDRRFDAAIFGTSTSRLLRPAVLDPIFGAHFANLAMNSATAYEQARMMDLFIRHHPAPAAILVGLDVQWCVRAGGLERFTFREFPEWMYSGNRWAGYLHMFNLYTLEKAGQAFAEFTGLKPEVYGRDGYTSFVPRDDSYDPARAAAHLREWSVYALPGRGDGPPAAWAFPALDLLRARLATLPASTRKVLFFVPYSRVVLPPGPGPVQTAWDECKRRVAAIADTMPGTVAVDFMRPSPITLTDTNYWDGLHYRQPIADRLARDLGGALQGRAAPDGGDAILGQRR